MFSRAGWKVLYFSWAKLQWKYKIVFILIFQRKNFNVLAETQITKYFN